MVGSKKLNHSEIKRIKLQAKESNFQISQTCNKRNFPMHKDSTKTAKLSTRLYRMS